ncbi:UDP-glucosyl transferase 72B3 [Heracleum sosnowskyi]|uniref:UDP-glucosyl transferase 72B3 n=1 Tax=Heracleum sosnowskyi TaxID=360622 RepID=A0AAD8MMH5_9APIA|nr:UDP-glucosyl transferase 72B3 [Heracleum sosnowskyi]
MVEPTSSQPHVLIFPFPVQGHINSMLKLTELLCLANIHVTYLLTVETHTRLLANTDVSRYTKYPGFRFQTLPESVSDGNAQSMDIILNLHESMKTAKAFLRNLLLCEGLKKPVTCIITDGVMRFTLDIGKEIGVPVIYFRTISACSFWSYFCMNKLIEAEECPFKGDDMDYPIKSVPGMESFLRRRDLPSLFRVADTSDGSFQMWLTETQQTVRAQALILNTFEDLEGPILSQIRTQIPNIYTIGPLHAHLKAQTKLETTSSRLASSNSLWKEDKGCIKWLENQPLKSVIYINSRFVGEVWKLGLDIKDTCDRVIIEEAVKDLMCERNEEFTDSAKDMATLASKAVNVGGSSHSNLNRLIQDIKSMSVLSQHA